MAGDELRIIGIFGGYFEECIKHDESFSEKLFHLRFVFLFSPEKSYTSYDQQVAEIVQVSLFLGFWGYPTFERCVPGILFQSQNPQNPETREYSFRNFLRDPWTPRYKSMSEVVVGELKRDIPLSYL